MPPDRPSIAHHESSPSSPAIGERTTFEIAVSGARRVLRRRFRVLRLVRDAYERMADQSTALAAARHDLGTFLRLLSAWAQRSYERVPWTPLLLIAGAVIYFVAPLDLIPDALIGIGFVDDVAVISAVVRAVRDELDRFQAWETQRHTDPPKNQLPSAATNGSAVSS